MNNSDLIAALSLGITAIIFLVQTDDGLLRLKIRNREKWLLGVLLLVILALINYSIFERAGIVVYFTIKGFYLQPSEWALLIFLFLLFVMIQRIFTSKIFNNNPFVILPLVKKYRHEKKWNKLQNLLISVTDLEDFEEHYAETLNDTIFNDYHFVEHFASDYPELIIKFCRKNPDASINRGDHFYHILNGLFADKSNPIFAEIRHYYNETEKGVFLEELLDLRFKEGFTFDPNKNYKSSLPIVTWLTNIVASEPSNLKQEISYFLRSFRNISSVTNNEEIYSETEIKRINSRDTVFNAIQLFRIILVEYCFTRKRVPMSVDRVLLLLYSTWDFVEINTKILGDAKVVLNNDDYTINEYYLKQLFYSYLSLYFLLQYVRPYRSNKGTNNYDSSDWPLKQLFAKLDSLWGKIGTVSDRSKRYYMERLFELYFEMPKYFQENMQVAENCRDSLLWYMKDSLTKSPYGNVTLIREVFNDACEHFDFIEYNFELKDSAIRFYNYLLPYTKEYELRIA